MAPLRNNRVNNRSTRTQPDHDIMEGLPVRQWRKTVGSVNAPPPREDINANAQNTGIWTELSMPRGSELYTPMSQALLRAARMGHFRKTSSTPLEDDKEQGEDEDADGEVDSAFVVNKWSQVAKNMEEPEIEFLAKRRKGLPSVYGTTVGTLAPMRKTKVRKVDAEGNTVVLDVLVPEGTVVDGEIVEDETVITEAPPPGTIVEGVGIVNAEGIVVAGDQMMSMHRRKPPPPKRKPKGPGRGRKKKVLIQEASVTSAPGAAPTTIAVAVDATTTDPQARKPETSAADGTHNEDSEMLDNSIIQDEDDGSDDDDEDGDDGEDGDREEGEVSPSPDADARGSEMATPQPKHSPLVQTAMLNSSQTARETEAEIRRPPEIFVSSASVATPEPEADTTEMQATAEPTTMENSSDTAMEIQTDQQDAFADDLTDAPVDSIMEDAIAMTSIDAVTEKGPLTPPSTAAAAHPENEPIAETVLEPINEQTDMMIYEALLSNVTSTSPVTQGHDAQDQPVLPATEAISEEIPLLEPLLTAVADFPSLPTITAPILEPAVESESVAEPAADLHIADAVDEAVASLTEEPKPEQTPILDPIEESELTIAPPPGDVAPPEPVEIAAVEPLESTPEVAAELPVEHNPLEGLTEPQAEKPDQVQQQVVANVQDEPSAKEKQESGSQEGETSKNEDHGSAQEKEVEPDGQDVPFPDGDIDLFGTLERQLG
ncbi:hypothetical protein MMC25_001977 [Agyrium rufum]|nr:hypothetical protein [Agyrium rufum]